MEHNHPIVLVVGIVSTIMMMIAYFLTAKVYREKGFREVLYISIGILLVIPIPVAFTYAEFIHGPEFNKLRTVIDITGLFLGAVGGYILWRSFLSIRGEHPHGYQNFLAPCLFFAFGYMTLNVSWEWIDNRWIINYTPPIGLIVTGLPNLWLVAELNIIAYKNYQESTEKNTPLKMCVVGFFFILISIIAIVIERLISPGSSIFFLLFMGLGQVTIASALMVYPGMLVPKLVKPHYFIVSNHNNGTTIFEYNFPHTSKLPRSTMFSGAMSGILALLGELTERTDLPPMLGYIDLTILISEKNDLIGYLIVDKPIPPLRVTLNKTMDEISRILSNRVVIKKQEKELIQQTIERNFDYL